MSHSFYIICLSDKLPRKLCYTLDKDRRANMKWNANLYDSKHDFVAAYGKGLLSYLPSNKQAKILDLGCGTGTLTDEISKTYPNIMGIDGSKEMIAKAKAAYPTLNFEVVDALNMTDDSQWDIVFSNAVFHWIPDHDQLLHTIKKSLNSNGQLICEFGGFGNIATIEQAFKTLLVSKGYTYTSRFNFSTAENFGELLEKNGFDIELLVLYDRPTVLKDQEKGLYNWASQFFDTDLAKFSHSEQDSILTELEDLVRRQLWHEDHWEADYRRLRAVAHLKA